MESANVWFYRIKNDNLFVFDTGVGEFDFLGPADQQLAELIGPMGRHDGDLNI